MPINLRDRWQCGYFGRWRRRQSGAFPLVGPPLFSARKMGLLRVQTYPAQARFQFGGGRMRDVRIAADVTEGIAGATGNLMAFVSDAEIPALLRKGA